MVAGVCAGSFVTFQYGTTVVGTLGILPNGYGIATFLDRGDPF
jgi:hypothetical protein